MIQFPSRVWERCKKGGWRSRRVEDADKARRVDVLNVLAERDPERRRLLEEAFQKKYEQWLSLRV